MGFKNFFNGFKSTFHECILYENDVEHDVLVVELNGLFYKSCKILYKRKDISDIPKKKLQLLFFEEVVKEMNNIVMKHPPKDTLLFVVDGVPGMMKNMEQRQRRYKNSLENKYPNVWDLNVFSPGTKVMHYLTKYIDWYLRKKVMNHHLYRHLKVIFSNEKVYGEGEWKISKFIKNIVKQKQKILIYSSDSDLILIAMLLHEYSIRIVRHSNEYGKEFVSIDTFKELLKKKYCFSENETLFFSDIYLLLLLLGNDYITSSPCVFDFTLFEKEILPSYKQFQKHFTINGISLHTENLCGFFKKLSIYEQKWLVQQYKNQKQCFPDKIFLKYYSTDMEEINFEKYKEEYNSKYFKNDYTNQHIVEYLYILQNIMKMVKMEDFDWSLIYKYSKSPFLSDFSPFIFHGEKMKVLANNNKIPSKNICFHLLSVIPPSSKYLLPDVYKTVFLEFNENYPSRLEFDLTGKKKIWEAFLQLPPFQFTKLSHYFFKYWKDLTKEEKKLFRSGKTFQYIYSTKSFQKFESFYGNIDKMNVSIKLLDI